MLNVQEQSGKSVCVEQRYTQNIIVHYYVKHGRVYIIYLFSLVSFAAVRTRICSQGTDSVQNSMFLLHTEREGPAGM